MQNEAYEPVIADGRGRFPEDLRVKAPRGAGNAIEIAASKCNTTKSEWIRQALLKGLEADGITIRRGMVELSGEASMPFPLTAAARAKTGTDK
jgi:hypothetical protein